MVDETLQPAPRRRPLPLWFVVAAMVVGLVLGFVILLRIAGPLYELIFPLEVPVPDSAEQVEHSKPDSGAEFWVYRTRSTGREVAAFYEEEGGTCQFSPRPTDLTAGQSYSAARCIGETEGKAQSIMWEVYISEGYPDPDGPTVFRIYRFEEL